MKAAPLPDNEAERLESLRRYRVLDTGAETAYDDLTALASQVCGTPIALISLVDEKRQWFKSRVGLAATETPRDLAFCAHAIQGGELFVVPDALADERFADNPLVLGEPRVRFYAGAPLVTPEGHAIGTLCAIDHEPRELSGKQRAALQALARQVMAQLELRRHAEQLLRLNAGKDRLLALLSHDLRAPFHGILGYAAALRDGAGRMAPAEVETCAGGIHQSASVALRLMDNLLAWSRFELGTLKYRPGPVALGPLVAEVSQLLSANARQKSLRLVYRPETPRLTLVADPNMLHSVLQNLLSNAIRVSPAGAEVGVVARVGDGEVVVSVSDSGPGMEPERLRQILAGEDCASAGGGVRPGAGLGLALCREFTALMGGPLAVESRPGQGSTFSFSLRLAP